MTDPAADAKTTARHPRLERTARIGRSVLPPLAYLALSVWMWHALLPTGLTSHALAGGLLDPSIFIWWLRWTPFALLHGMNPFVSGYLLAPRGANAMQNTSVIALGVLFTPVTELFGAVTSYNLLCIIGPAATAWAAQLWLRRHVGRMPAFVGGLLFGFSPFVVAHSHGDHLNLTVLALVPLIVMLVEDLLWRDPRPWWPRGPLLGLLVGVQLLIGSEALAVTALGCLGLCVVVAVAYPRHVAARVPAFAAGAGAALGTAALACSWPLYEQLSASPRLVAVAKVSDYYTGRPALLVNPPPTMQLHTAASAALTTSLLSSVENGLYIGIPLLVVLAVALAVAVSRRRRPVLVAGVLGLVATGVTLGWPPRIPGITGKTPLRILQDHVNLLANLLPARFAIVVWLAIAFVVADLLDRLAVLHPVARRLATGAVCLSLVPLFPGPLPYIEPVPPAPAFFTTASGPSLPEGATLMVAPMATIWDSAAMLWQVQSGMRFRQVGGYVQHPGIDGHQQSLPYATQLTTLFAISFTGLPDDHRPTPTVLSAARRELRESGSSALVVAITNPIWYRVQYVRAVQLLGRPPDRITGGVAVWYLATG